MLSVGSTRIARYNTGIVVAFAVENAEDAAVAEEIAAGISAAAGLANLGAQTGATATVAEAPTFALEVEMEVATSDAAAVSAKITDGATNAALATNLAAEGIDGVTVAVAEVPTIQENTSPAAILLVTDDGSFAAHVPVAGARDDARGHTCTCTRDHPAEFVQCRRI